MTASYLHFFEAAVYPCYWLGNDGTFWMNSTARQAAPAESTAVQLVRKMMQQALGRETQAHIHLLALHALRAEGFTLLPAQGGILAAGVAEAGLASPQLSTQLREPISNMMSTLPLLAKRLDEADMGYAEDLQNNCYQLLRLSTNLESLAKAESAVADEAFPALDLTELVASVADGFESVYKGADVPLELLLPDVSLPVRADATLLADAILNILRNSVQYTRDGNRIRLRLYSTGTRAVLTVEDRGLGILSQTLPHIFDPYFSQDPYGDTPERPGAGLGLAVARQVARRHGGSITAESEFGVGSRISLSFPLGSAPEGEMLGSDATAYLLNRFSPLYVQLCGYCHYPTL